MCDDVKPKTKMKINAVKVPHIPQIPIIISDNISLQTINSDKKQDKIESFRVIKHNLSKIIRNKNHIQIINNTVEMANRITIHTLNYLKLYLLLKYESKEKLPEITSNLISNIMIVICEASDISIKKGGRQPNQIT